MIRPRCARANGGILKVVSAVDQPIMPAGRGKKPAKSAGPRAPAEDALCPEMDDFHRDSGPEDSPGNSPSLSNVLRHVCSGCLPIQYLIPFPAERDHTTKVLG